jgi:dipeptidyl aminopeptidase/acylaminoacyl peptidase
MATEAPYGTWSSPIGGDDVARAGGRRYSMLAAADGAVYWSESRPLEGGRSVVVRKDPGAAPVDVTPEGFNVRTRVQEYGGGAFVLHGSTVLFSNFADQRVYRQDGVGAEPRPITPEPDVPAGARYADGRLTADGSLLIAVRERVAEPEPVNELIAIPADGSGDPRLIASGHDFFAAPRVSPDGRRLAWLSWDHPRMPWDGTELWLADLGADGMLGEPELVAGGPDEAILQPEWSRDGALHFISDRTGWWNLYRAGDAGPEALARLEADLGGPMWVFGMSWYGFLEDGRIACTYVEDGRDRLAIVGTGLETLEVPWTTIEDLATDGSRILLVGSSPAEPARVLAFEPASGDVEELSVADDEPLDPAYVSEPRPVAYPTTGGETAYALLYPPHNADFTGPASERPPLVVHVHGGPTAHVTPELLPSIQFFTSRGFAVADVNYGGSSGYGRAYRQRLKGEWGVVDVDDSVNVARHLADEGEVDSERMAITGGSAGGWTVLCALALHQVFACGADYFGVSDLAGFKESTHKFESRYDDWLAGTSAEVRHERSPLTHVDRIRVPVIVLQGLEDAIVPPEQSELIVEALARNGIPHAYIAFEGEQHGFRKAENIKRAIEAELSFYGQVLGFEPAGGIEPVTLSSR